MQLDGSNSARARSARIRASHDDEATLLESMRRNGRTRDLHRRPRASLATRLASLVRRGRRAGDEPLRGGLALDATSDPITAITPAE
jgi:hypothetical protein